MTIKTLSRTLAAAFTAATLVAAPVAPAFAGGSGQVALSITPRTAEEAQLLRLGLAVYALRRDVRSNGHVTQSGVNNAAGIYQGGPNNQAIVHQEGCNHTGSISQRGANNAHGLFQFGCNTTGHVSQTGHNNTGVTVLFGW